MGSTVLIMAGLIRRIRSSKFLSNLAILVSGTAIAQAIAWIATPILTRIFAPESFGVLGVFVSVVALLTVLGTLRYDQAILLEQNEEAASRILTLCLIISTCVAALALAVTIVLSGPLGDRNPESQIFDFLIFMPLLVLASGVRAVANMWSIRSKRFTEVASSAVLQTGCRVTVQLMAGLLGAGTAGLIGGALVGTTVAAVFLTTYVLKDGYLKHLGRLDVRATWYLAKRHYRFPLYSAPTALLERVGKRGPVILLAIFFSPVVAGYYWMTFAILVHPVRLLTRNTRKAFYQRAVEISRKRKSLAPLFIKSTCTLGLVPILPMACLALFGPPLFEFVFGSEWRKAGEYAQWLCLIPIATLMRVPSIELSPIYNQQGQVLIIQTVHTIARVAAILIGALSGDDLLAIALFSITTCIMSVFIILYFWRLISQVPTVATPGVVPDTLEVE